VLSITNPPPSNLATSYRFMYAFGNHSSNGKCRDTSINHRFRCCNNI
jgi:hypothetical protein